MTALRVWAPDASSVAVRLGAGDEAMTKVDDGWWESPALPSGTDYGFVLDGEADALPDPASRWQPNGVHGLSRVYDPDAHQWQDAGWAGRDLTDAVVYEMHIGTFTHLATLDGAIERLPDLVDLGVTHLELLPVNAVNGVWNWGYDGVDWYAVHQPLGGPDALKRFVDAAHGHGLAVVIDVVYNHLGPSGNYLPRFGPYLKTGRNTWGDLVNVEQPQVRRFVIDNALMWLRDFHADALRLDAVHAIHDDSPKHVLAELADEVHALAAEVGRPLTLIAESDLNDPVMITPTDEGGRGMDAQWDDDVHHALHSNLTGETQGYYVDFGELSALAKAYTKAFVHDGTYSTFRKAKHGAPIDPAKQLGSQFVVCLQDHDQVGNRAVGNRLPELTSHALVQVGAVLLLTSPFTPMLWMGEEWAASTRWPFFTSHPEPELAAAVSKGREEEFAGHGWDVSAMIDPQDPRAYREAVLRWDERSEPGHADVLDLYRRLIALRHAEPGLRDPDMRRVAVDFDQAARWVSITRPGFRVVANLGSAPVDVPVDAEVTETVLVTGSAAVDGRTVRLGEQSSAILRME